MPKPDGNLIATGSLWPATLVGLGAGVALAALVIACLHSTWELVLS